VYGVAHRHTNGEEYAVSNDTEFELEYWQDRVDALAVTNQALQEERDRYMDAAESLAKELDALKATMKQAESVISRLRNHISQGVEL
jgi:predicted nuclease with TOPRIM domain